MSRRLVQLPPRRQLAMTEAQLTTAVVQLARMFGWYRSHAWTSVHSASGWPDEVLVRPPRVVMAELKSDTGKTSAEQDRVLALLRDCPGVEVYLWRPADLRAGLIQEVLRR